MHAMLENLPEEWKTAAHCLKGAAANLGMQPLSQLAATAEYAHTYNMRKEAIDEITDEFARVELYIEKLQKRQV